MLLIQNALKPPKLRVYGRTEKILDSRKRDLNDFDECAILE